MSKPSTASRRTVLQLTGGALGTAAAVGEATATRTGATESDDKPVELNVGYESEAGRRAALDAAAEVVREFDFPTVTVRAPERAAEALRSRPDVSYVEPNGRLQALGQSVPWNVAKVGGSNAPCDGIGADVAILDTGIDSDHPDLQSNLGSGQAYVPCTGSCNQPWDDDNGHGTNCAGVVAAGDNFRGVVGVAPGATLHAVKVLDDTGNGSVSDIAAGIQYTANQGWDVLNVSFGGPHYATIENAVQYADNNGVLVVAAAGPGSGTTISYPAAYPECVAVSGVTKSGSLESSSGSGPAVDVAAPGADVLTTALGGGTTTFTGSSIACAHASGAAALAMAQGSSNSQARQALADTANELYGLTSNEQGAGLVNADALC